jgi:anti-sigma factor RsiW
VKILGRLIGTRHRLSCRQVAKLLQTYLDDELDSDAARKVEDHLEDCIRCGLETEAYQALKASLQRVPAGSTADAVARLRAFGEQLARTEPEGEPQP